MIVKDNFIGTRIFNELVNLGFKGSQTALYDYIRKIKGNINISNISERFETYPGKQSQFDWSEYSILLNGILRRKWE